MGRSDGIGARFGGASMDFDTPDVDLGNKDG